VTCRELTAFLDDYLAGELPAETRVRFEAHLAVCVNCHVYLAQYQETIELGRRAFVEDDETPAMPDDLIQAIVKSLKDE
jgi:anti-sigma factor RsiW